MNAINEPFFVQDIVEVLRTDLSSVGTDLMFACRPLKGCTKERDTVLGRFKGALGLAECNDFHAALEEMVTDRLIKVIIDLAEVSLTRSAIGTLVAFASTMHGRNKKLYLFRVSEQIRSNLEELNLIDFFTFLETEEDIISRFVL